jgi:hypothetical protein
MTSNNRQKLIAAYAELLNPSGIIPASERHEILREAAKMAGWVEPSFAMESRQKKAATARVVQRREDQAYRRIMVAYHFRHLPQRLRDKPSSTATAQAIMKRIDENNTSDWKPPMTESTVQEDIRYMKRNGNFGILRNRTASLGSP